MLKTVIMPNIFVAIVIHFIFQVSQMNRKIKRAAFTVNTVNLEQFNAHFLIKSINFKVIKY